MATEIWPTVHDERKALAADLEGLSDPQWETPSLCPGWTTRDVLAHMTATASITPGRFFGGMVSNGFRFERLQAKGVAEQRGASPADTLTRFKARESATTHPPGPVDSMLGETVVHAEDIRRPLGLTRVYPTEALVRVADFYKRSNLLIGAKRRIDGVRLRATDTDWSHGEGPELSGPMLSLLLAMVGRKQALDDLSGPGTETLRSRP